METIATIFMIIGIAVVVEKTINFIEYISR
jgi:hypothetical protein